MEEKIKYYLNRVEKLKGVIFPLEKGEEIFESYREEAKNVLKAVKKDSKRPTEISKLMLRLTTQQLEDHIITEFLYEDIKLLIGPELEERKGKWDV